MNENKKKKRKGLKIFLLVLLLLILIPAGYVAYVFLSYSRIEDNLELKPEGDAADKVTTGKE